MLLLRKEKTLWQKQSSQNKERQALGLSGGKTMFKYKDYYEENKDTVAVSEEQIAFISALALANAVNQIGK